VWAQRGRLRKPSCFESGDNRPVFRAHRSAGAFAEVDCSVVINEAQQGAGQAPAGLTERLASVGNLIDRGRISDARAILDAAMSEPSDLVDLMRLKLRVAAREIEPATAMQRVVLFLERAPRHPVAVGLYQELSLLQYQEGRSCPSFSHPPPRGR
jgi:hypothetical protein